jgi:flagellar biosynthesis protein FlhA
MSNFKVWISNFFRYIPNPFIALTVVPMVLMVIIPLPFMLLDIFMITNLGISLLIFLLVLCARKSSDYYFIPTVLLEVSIFGLALNVAANRLILTMGAKFDSRMIGAFSTSFVGSSGIAGLVVGFVIFIISTTGLVLIIAKGAARIAEVAARFALDSLPGKQIAIEAEYSAQIITGEEAIGRKKKLQHEVDFYGALDGSSKFFFRNVKVGILITAVTILGGSAIGVTIRGESIYNAMQTYITFAIGASILITMIPTMLIAAAIGIIVIRSGLKDAL